MHTNHVIFEVEILETHSISKLINFILWMAFTHMSPQAILPFYLITLSPISLYVPKLILFSFVTQSPFLIFSMIQFQSDLFEILVVSTVAFFMKFESLTL